MVRKIDPFKEPDPQTDIFQFIEIDKSTTYTIQYCNVCGFVAKTKKEYGDHEHQDWGQFEIPKDEFSKFPRKVNLSGPEPLIKKVDKNGK